MKAAGPQHKASLVIRNRIAEMEKVVDFVDRFGAAHDLPKPVTDDLNLCLDELLNNTISYGYVDRQPRSIVVVLLLTPGLLAAEVQDDGKPFDLRKAAPATPRGSLRSRKTGGLGIHFVKALMDEVAYMRAGRHNVVRIRKRLA
jgi:anti-sigma regulatory factor (Ser/Thr protein kinase)